MRSCYDHQGGNGKEAAAEAVLNLYRDWVSACARAVSSQEAMEAVASTRKARASGPKAATMIRIRQGCIYVSADTAVVRLCAIKEGWGPDRTTARCPFALERHQCERVLPWACRTVQCLHRGCAGSRNRLIRIDSQASILKREAVGVTLTPSETLPLVKDRLIDFTRCRIAAIGGIAPSAQIVSMCELVRTGPLFREAATAR